MIYLDDVIILSCRYITSIHMNCSKTTRYPQTSFPIFAVYINMVVQCQLIIQTNFATLFAISTLKCDWCWKASRNQIQHHSKSYCIIPICAVYNDFLVLGKTNLTCTVAKFIPVKAVRLAPCTLFKANDNQWWINTRRWYRVYLSIELVY